jgi:citrate lyase beta subunit
LKHFSYLTGTQVEEVFHVPPGEFTRRSDRDLLAYSLGATLYMPGTRKEIASDIRSGKFLDGRFAGLISMVMCLEDSISDVEVEEATDNIAAQVNKLFEWVEQGELKEEQIPLMFIRVRHSDQMNELFLKMGKAIVLLSGFVFPKFTSENGRIYFETLKNMNRSLDFPLYGMPILESADVMYKETRLTSLLAIKEVIDGYQSLVLNVRMGATDFSGLFGIRRSSDTTIYDIEVLRDCISDLINVFGRSEKEYVMSGPVWEYFEGATRVLKPQIRRTPFQQVFGRNGLDYRLDMIDKYEDGLIHEILLDKTNGLVGKTIIHPSHIVAVHSMNVVGYEEYLDACAIIEKADAFNGVIRSEFANKMNEIKPHINWAKKIMLKSKVYGVFHEQQSFIDILSISQERFVQL